MGKADETKALILKLAQKEFSEKGFKDASARNIAKTGNITTGAIYRYFPNNESIFSALVEPAADELYKLYSGTQQNFLHTAAPAQRSQALASDSDEPNLLILDCLYRHKEAFKLIISGSAGTPYASYIDRLSDISIQNTYAFIDVLRQDGRDIKPVSDHAIRTICRDNIFVFFHVIEMDLPKDEAVRYIKEMFRFYNSGWKTLLGI